MVTDRNEAECPESAPGCRTSAEHFLEQGGHMLSHLQPWKEKTPLSLAFFLKSEIWHHQNAVHLDLCGTDRIATSQKVKANFLRTCYNRHRATRCSNLLGQVASFPRYLFLLMLECLTHLSCTCEAFATLRDGNITACPWAYRAQGTACGMWLPGLLLQWLPFLLFVFQHIHPNTLISLLVP